MTTGQEMLADAVRNSRDLFVRFLDGFDDTTRTRQAPDLPNHVAWCLGHCAITMHRMAQKLDDVTLPEADFVAGDGTSGDAERFDTESVSYGSSPIDDPQIYPTLERAQAIFDTAVERLATAVERASDDDLARPDAMGSRGGADGTPRDARLFPQRDARGPDHGPASCVVDGRRDWLTVLVTGDQSRAHSDGTSPCAAWMRLLIPPRPRQSVMMSIHAGVMSWARSSRMRFVTAS